MSAGVAASPSAVLATTPLNVLTWSEYIDPDIVAEFEAAHGARVEFEYFESDELRDRTLSERGGEGYDVIVVNGVQIGRYAKRGWIEPLARLDIPHAAAIEQRWQDAFAESSAYGVAYFWGTLGIAYREDLWPTGFLSWIDFLTPDRALAGRIGMTSYGRELVGLALKAAGHSANDPDRSRIAAAGELLQAQSPWVAGYGYPELDRSAPLVTGATIAAMMYSGDALVLRDLEPAIRYVVPVEGGLIWTDYLTVSSHSSNKALAAAFIDFLNRPTVAARNAEFVSYASPNAAAAALLPGEFLDDPIIYPAESVLRASEFLTPLPTRSRKLVNTIGARLLYR